MSAYVEFAIAGAGRALILADDILGVLTPQPDIEAAASPDNPLRILLKGREETLDDVIAMSAREVIARKHAAKDLAKANGFYIFSLNI